MAQNVKINQLRQQMAVFFRRGIIVKIAFVVLVLFLFVAVFAGALTPYDPNAQVLVENLQDPSRLHWLGTDYLGRDVLSRLIYGARISLICSVLSGLIGAAIGIVFGLVAGFYDGRTAQVILRVTDAQLSIPPIILTMILCSVLGGGIKSVVISIAVGMIPTYIRMVYGQVLSLRENDFVTAAMLIGQNRTTIMSRHLLPNCIPSMIVLFTVNLGTAIMVESSLSYLGYGIAPPTATWGGMVSDGYNYLGSHPLMAILPGVCIILIVVAFNVVGDSLRDVLDPRLRGKV